MKIAVLGGTGKVGQLLVPMLLNNGHEVTLLVHKHSHFNAVPGLHLISGDVHNPDDIAKLIENSEAVVSTLGSWGTKTKDIVSSAVKNLIPAMQAQKVSRIVTLTGSGARASVYQKSLLESIGHGVFSIIAGKIVKDSEDHIKLLENSPLDYTIIRSPVMKNGRDKGFVLNSKIPGALELINRVAVAAAMLEVIEKGSHKREAPFIHGS